MSDKQPNPRAPKARHPGVTELLSWFDAEHLLPGRVRMTSQAVGALAADIADGLPDSAELTAGLRKLLEAKDCFVRAAISADWADRSR